MTRHCSVCKMQMLSLALMSSIACSLPRTEHSKRSPNCGFLTLKKDVIELTVADYYQMEKERLKIYLVSDLKIGVVCVMK